jgi:hypothetical protein
MRVQVRPVVGLCALSDKINADALARVLYLASSPEIVTQMYQNWPLLNGSPRAEFKSYDELFEVDKIENEVLTIWISRFEDFKIFEARYLLKEFSMLMRIDTLERYLALDKRQSIFSTQIEKQKA